MSDRALYYPYIHIQDVEWLKGTLLLFSQVRRMTPGYGPQAGDGAIAPFTGSLGSHEPLVTSADLWSKRALAAQGELADHLRRDGADPEFQNRYNSDAAEALRAAGGERFQIYYDKIDDRLKDALRYTGLAWEPGKPKTCNPSLEYVEVHPRVGEAIMATLAIACAMGEGLDIVGDKRSGRLHECLTTKNPKDVYDTWLKRAPGMADPPQPDATELFEFVVSIACDTTKLDAHALAEMGANREPIRRLMHELSERAKTMVAMDPGKERTEQFKDETAKILAAWSADRLNMDRYWKNFFTFGLMDPGTKFLEKVVGKMAEATPAAAGIAGVGAAGLVLQGALLGSGLGLGFGLLSHGAKTYNDLRKRDKASPYRYLTIMEGAGVVFRTDVRDDSGDPRNGVRSAGPDPDAGGAA